MSVWHEMTKWSNGTVSGLSSQHVRIYVGMIGSKDTHSMTHPINNRPVPQKLCTALASYYCRAANNIILYIYIFLDWSLWCFCTQSFHHTLGAELVALSSSGPVSLCVGIVYVCTLLLMWWWCESVCARERERERERASFRRTRPEKQVNW